MAPWLAVLAMIELSPPVLGPPGEARPDPGDDLRTEGTGSREVPPSFGLDRTEAELVREGMFAAPLVDEGGRGGRAPTCSGDLCQPRVSVPGFEPRFDARGKRTELVLLALDRAHVEPLASVAWAMTATGLRLDYAPPQLQGGLATGHGGWGRLVVFLRWRLDATNAPVWPARGN